MAGARRTPTASLENRHADFDSTERLLRAGAGLYITGHIRHTGTAATWSAQFRIGTSNTSSDSSILPAGSAATTDLTARVDQEFNFTSTTEAYTSYNLAPNGSAGAGSFTIRNANINTNSDMFVGVYASSLTNPDVVQLCNYAVYLID